MSLTDPFEEARRRVTPNYNPARVIFQAGEGTYLFDENKKRYLDFAAGIAVCSLGHGHPALTAALTDQIASLIHVSNLYYNGPAIELAAMLCERSFADRVFFANSGTEANEAAFKIARRYQQVVLGKPQRHGFICMNGSFHGRTWASVSATGQPKYHEGFGPLVPGFVHVPYDDLGAVEAAIDDTTCAVMVEPIQGESGVIVPSDGYLAGLRRICDDYGIILIFDEVQTGVGRTGRLWAHEHWGVTPDVMTVAKGLGGGVPIGVMLCTEVVSEGFQPGVHASTFGGNALACRAGVTVLDVIEREGLVEHAARVGDHLALRLTELKSRHSGLRDVRGKGLLAGIGVDPAAVDRAAVRQKALGMGLLISQAGQDALRLTPPLIAGCGHVDDAIDLLDSALRAL